MATSEGSIAFLLDQLASTGAASARKMFGEYCLYYSGKPIGLVCDEVLYLKKTAGGAALLGDDKVEGFPYKGATSHFRVDQDRWEDAERLCELARATWREAPEPKRRGPKKPKAR